MAQHPSSMVEQNNLSLLGCLFDYPLGLQMLGIVCSTAHVCYSKANLLIHQ